MSNNNNNNNNNNIIFKPLTFEYIDKAYKLLTEDFIFREPVCSTVNCDINDFKVISNDPIGYCNELSLIAINQDNDEIAAVCFCKDYADPAFDKHITVTPKSAIVIKLLDDLHNKKIIDTDQLNEYFHIYFIATAIKYSGQGIMSKLLHLSIELATSKGFKKIFAEGTGIVSTNLFVRFGFEIKASISYKDWPYIDNSFPYLTITEKHSQISLVIKNLN
eukprot:TRINITY_DN131_c3_g1_i1.p1 TRINITY_DN131_c3_g1~~TRINITY_DN131_c3_g1_i1.p1  ORF type:complete len:219 (-),score=86.23 TRINITY_DN131_c3_g1_i1:50-706(-)